MNKKNVLRTPSILRVKRREALGFISSTVIVSLLGCQREDATATTATQKDIELPACVVSPQQTEGPYFVEEELNRSDIRSDPSNGLVKEGVPLRLVLRVSQVSAGTCTPLEGAVVDVWHCDAAGVYSGVRDRSLTTVDRKFLRGSQITDSTGTVEFITIYPGSYPGRAVHVHFKVRNSTAPQGYEFTSQLYFDNALTDQVYTQAPYNTTEQRPIRNERDFIYRDGGEQLTLQLAPEAAGYTGTFNIGLQMA